MKSILIGVITLFSFTLNAQNMKNPQDIITRLFVKTDQKDWSEVEKCFADKVVLDYSSMNGNPATELTPTEITTAWKGILPGFDYTHHQLGNFQISQNETQAQVFCYGTATHYLEDESGNIWTVVGTYDFELKRVANENWQVSHMKFNFKYQNGNTSLPQKAIQRVSGQSITPDTATRNKETVKQFFQLLEKEDIPSLINLFAEDGKQINPYASGLFPEGANGKQELSAYWSPVPGNFAGMQFPIEEIYAMEDPSIVFVKYKGKIKLKNDAGYYENDYYSTFKFNTAGQIIEYVEIFNPIVAAKGFGLLDQIK